IVATTREMASRVRVNVRVASDGESHEYSYPHAALAAPAAAPTQAAPATPWLTRRQAASYLGVSLRHFDQEIRRQVPSYPIGLASVRFARHDLDSWLATRKVGG